jgi:hypothetical protein
MKKTLIILIGLLSIIILIYGCSSYKNSANQVTNIKTNTVVNFIDKDSAEKDFKAKNDKELSTQDFEAAYKLGKSFLNDYYSQRAGASIINFSKYIVNENLLRYSNKRVLVENQDMDIKEVSIGLNKAHFILNEKSYYIAYSIATKDSNIGGFGEVVEILISNINGNLVISDWYIRYGAGSSSFDEKFRPNELINSPRIWDNQEYVKNIFEKAGIS